MPRPESPGQLLPRIVGAVSIAYQPSAGAPALYFGYTIENESGVKILEPQTWRSQLTLLQGSYDGGFSASVAPTGCAPESAHLGLPERIRLDVAALPGERMSIRWTGNDSSCVLEGAYRQQGQTATLDGEISCGRVTAAPAPAGTARVEAISVTHNGLSAALSLESGECSYSGRIGGVRRLANPG